MSTWLQSRGHGLRATSDGEKKQKASSRDYTRQEANGLDVFRGAVCLADSEQAGRLTALVRAHFNSAYVTIYKHWVWGCW